MEVGRRREIGGGGLVGREVRGALVFVVALSTIACRTRLLDETQRNDGTVAQPDGDSRLPDASTPPDLFSTHPIWPMQGGDPGQHYRSRLPGPEVPRLKWSFKVQGPLGASGPQPAVAADGTVYVASGGPVVHALDGATGTERWSFKTGAPARSSPAIGEDGTVFVHADDHTLYALDGPTGALRWSRAIGGTRADGKAYGSPPIVGADGTVFVSAIDGSAVAALDPASGAVRWLYPIGNAWVYHPTVSAAGTIHVAALGDRQPYTVTLHTVDANGRSLWSTPIQGISVSHAADGDRYYFCDGAGLHAWDAVRGKVLWTVKGKLFSPLLIFADQSVYAQFDEPSEPRLLDGASGAVRKSGQWAATCWPASMVLDSAGTIFYTGCDYYLRAFDLGAGRKKWEFQVADGKTIFSPIIGANGTVLVQSSDTLHAVGP